MTFDSITEKSDDFPKGVSHEENDDQSGSWSVLGAAGAQVVHARGFGGSRGGGGGSPAVSLAAASLAVESRAVASGGGGTRAAGPTGGESRGGYGGERIARRVLRRAAARGVRASGSGGAAAGHGAADRVPTSPALRYERRSRGICRCGTATRRSTRRTGRSRGICRRQPQSPRCHGRPEQPQDMPRADRHTPVGAAHVALPTDAGYGMPAAGAGAAAYAGYHQTAAVSGSVYAARGAAVRTSYSGSGMFGQGWYAAHPGAWNPTGWTAGRAWGAPPGPRSEPGTAGTPACSRSTTTTATTSPTRATRSTYGDQPVATADQYYQQASTLAQSQPAPDPNAGEWMPLGVFGLVQATSPTRTTSCSWPSTKSGSVGGNYYDVISGTKVPIQGAVDKQTQRLAWTVGNNKTTVGETGTLQPDQGRIAGADPHRQGQDPAMDAGAAQTTGTGGRSSDPQFAMPDNPASARLRNCAST